MAEPITPPSAYVRDALGAYLSENGFTVVTYDEAWAKFGFFGIPLWIPNRWGRPRALRFHDLHHVATGFGTDNTGEGEISCFELGSGLRGAGLYASLIITSGALLGFCISPTRALRAFRGGRTARSLFCVHHEYDELLAMTVGELRKLLRLPGEGLAREPAGLHSFAPKRPREQVGGMR